MPHTLKQARTSFHELNVLIMVPAAGIPHCIATQPLYASVENRLEKVTARECPHATGFPLLIIEEFGFKKAHSSC